MWRIVPIAICTKGSPRRGIGPSWCTQRNPSSRNKYPERYLHKDGFVKGMFFGDPSRSGTPGFCPLQRIPRKPSKFKPAPNTFKNRKKCPQGHQQLLKRHLKPSRGTSIYWISGNSETIQKPSFFTMVLTLAASVFCHHFHPWITKNMDLETISNLGTPKTLK